MTGPNRRAVLGGAAAAALLAGPAAAHTLWNQWRVYRRKHLLVVCHRQDPGAFAEAKALEALAAVELPSANMRIARAPHPGRIASLLGTGQLGYALVRPGEAAQLAAGEGEFAPYGPVETRLVGGVADWLLVADPAEPARHVWLLRSMLSQGRLPSAAELRSPVAFHPGAAAHDGGIPLEHLPDPA